MAQESRYQAELEAKETRFCVELKPNIVLIRFNMSVRSLSWKRLLGICNLWSKRFRLEVDRARLGLPPDQSHQRQPDQSSGPSTQPPPSAHSRSSPFFEVIWDCSHYEHCHQ